MRRLVVISLILIIVYILIKRSGLYSGLFAKASETAAKGFRVLTRGDKA